MFSCRIISVLPPRQNLGKLTSISDLSVRCRFFLSVMTAFSQYVRTVGRTYQTCMQDLYHMDGICTMFTSNITSMDTRAQSGAPSVEWSFQIMFRSALSIPNGISRYFRLVCRLQCHLFSTDGLTDRDMKHFLDQQVSPVRLSISIILASPPISGSG